MLTEVVPDPESLAVGPAGLVEPGPPTTLVPDHPVRGGGQRREARRGGGNNDDGREERLPASHCLFPGDRQELASFVSTVAS